MGVIRRSNLGSTDPTITCSGALHMPPLAPDYIIAVCVFVLQLHTITGLASEFQKTDGSFASWEVSVDCTDAVHLHDAHVA